MLEKVKVLTGDYKGEIASVTDYLKNYSKGGIIEVRYLKEHPELPKNRQLIPLDKVEFQ